MWSLGILYYVMVQGNYPFRSKNESELFEKIRQGHYDYIHEDISEKSKLLIRGLLNTNPQQRFTVQQLLSPEWLQWYSE
jgi:serine/threonine protein kinase